jgi:hypothetical protein
MTLADSRPRPQEQPAPPVSYEPRSPLVGADPALDPLVPVFERFAVAWPPDEPRKGERYKQPDPAEYMPLSDALTREFSGDAHFAAYSNPTILHRLKNPDGLEFHQVYPDGVVMVLLVLEFDAHHIARELRRQWWQDQQEPIDRLLSAHPSGYVWESPSGGRALYRLPKPVVLRTRQDCEAWDIWYKRIGLYVSRYGDDLIPFEADLACADWGHLQRVPHGTRKDWGPNPVNLATYGNPKEIGVWRHVPSDDNLADDIRTARKLLELFDARPPRPDGKESKNPYAPLLRKLLELQSPTPKPIPANDRTLEPSSPPAGEADTASSDRAWSRLTLACNAIVSAPIGDRWNTIRRQATKIGRLTPHLLDRQRAFQHLLQAAKDNGYAREHSNAESTIRSGLDAGAKRPIYRLTKGPILKWDRQDQVASGCAYPYTPTWKWIESLPHKVATSTAKLVAGVILQHRNLQSGRSFPSITTIARRIGRTDPVVVKAIKLLERNGVLAVTRRQVLVVSEDGETQKRNAVNTYVFRPPARGVLTTYPTERICNEDARQQKRLSPRPLSPFLAGKKPSHVSGEHQPDPNFGRTRAEAEPDHQPQPVLTGRPDPLAAPDPRDPSPASDPDGGQRPTGPRTFAADYPSDLESGTPDLEATWQAPSTSTRQSSPEPGSA